MRGDHARGAAALGGDRRGRRDGPDRERLRDRPGVGRHQGGGAAHLARRGAGDRVSAGVSLRPGRLERARLADDRLRRVRRVPEGRGGGGRRLPARHRRRGHGPRGPDAPAPARRRAALSNRLRARIRCAGPSAPRRSRALRSQRERWQRGLGETLDHNHEMLASPRFGRIGLGAMPYLMGVEYLGPLLEVAGVRDPAAGLGARPAASLAVSALPRRRGWSTGSASRSRRSCSRSSPSAGTASRGTCCASRERPWWRASGSASCTAGGGWSRCSPGGDARRSGTAHRGRGSRRAPRRASLAAGAGAGHTAQPATTGLHEPSGCVRRPTVRPSATAVQPGRTLAVSRARHSGAR